MTLGISDTFNIQINNNGAAAPLGDHVVKIVATPDTGVATSVDFKVQVRER